MKEEKDIDLWELALELLAPHNFDVKRWIADYNSIFGTSHTCGEEGEQELPTTEDVD